MFSSPISSGLRAVLLVGLIGSLAVPTATLLAQVAPDEDAIQSDYNTIITLTRQKRWPLVATAARTFLEAHPGDRRAPLTTLYLGQALLESGKQADAREVFAGFLKQFPNHERVELARYRLGEASHFIGDDEAAIAALGQYLKTAREGTLTNYARLYYGKSLTASDRAADAIASLQTLLKTPSLPAILREQGQLELARALVETDKLDQAEAAFRRTIETFPRGSRNDEARLGLGTMLFEAGRYADAQAVFDALVEERPNSPQVPTAQLNAGYAAYRDREFATALARFEQAGRNEEVAPAATYWTGLTLKAAGRPEEAAATLRKAYEAAPESELADRYLYYAADAERDAGNDAEAMRSFEQMATTLPESPLADDALYNAAEIAIEIDRLDVADTLLVRFEEQYAKSPLRAKLPILLARAEIARLELEPGIDLPKEKVDAIAERLQELFGDSGRTGDVARLLLARLQREQENREAAIASLDPILSREQADPAVQDEARLLAAAMLIEEGNADRAADLLSGVRPVSRTVAALLLAEAEAMQGDWDAANTALAALPDEGPPSRSERVSTLLTIAELAYEAMAYDVSAGWFQAALDRLDDEETGSRIVALSGLGYSQRESGRHADAAATFALLSPLADGNAPLLARTLYAEALSRQEIGQTDAAAALYRRGADKFGDLDGEVRTAADDEVASYAFNLAKGAARLAAGIGDADAADRYYGIATDQLLRRAEENRDEVDSHLFEWGTVLLKAERFDRSDAVFRQLVTLAPESDLAANARLYLAESLFFSENDADHVASAQPLAALFDDAAAAADVRMRAGELLLDLLAEQEATEEQLRVSAAFVDRFPDAAAYARYRKAESLSQLGKFGEAIPVLNQLVEQAGTPIGQADWFDGVYVLLIDALVRQRKYEEAEAVATAFQTTRPDSPRGPEADELIGRSLKARAMFPEARQRLAKVVTDPRSKLTETAAKAQLTIADTYLLEEAWDKALLDYLKVYATYEYPAYQAMALYQAGVCDEKQGQFTTAKSTYETVLKEFPQSPEAGKAAERIAEIDKAVP